MFYYTVEPRHNEVLGTMKITLLYQVFHYIRAKKQRSIKSWDQQNYLVITGFRYIRPLYNEVPLYWYNIIIHCHCTKVNNVSKTSLAILNLFDCHHSPTNYLGSTGDESIWGNT